MIACAGMNRAAMDVSILFMPSRYRSQEQERSAQAIVCSSTAHEGRNPVWFGIRTVDSAEHRVLPADGLTETVPFCPTSRCALDGARRHFCVLA
jgi:hypothetical protein